MQAVYYRLSDGSEPVDEFIERLTIERQVIIDNQVARLNMLSPDDPPLPFPHSSQIEGELRELRCHCGSELYRILYRRSGNLFVLLHMIRKGGRSVPRGDIDLANARWDDFKARMHADPRVPPRAAGHDAPPKRESSSG
jgi:phage-related protein